MRYDLAELDQRRIMASLRAKPTTTRTLRIAVLADFATQHLIPLLRGLFARNQIEAEIHAGDYDTIETEIHDPGSELYAFNPKFIVILCATQKLTARFYASADAGDFIARETGRLAQLWSAVRARCSATIIQGNYITPSERSFGHYELMVDVSLGHAVSRINAHMVQDARHAGNVLLCDIDHIAGEIGRRHWFDERLWHIAKYPCRVEHLPLIAQGIVDVALAVLGPFVKCVILDLDNTLWGGVIGDDGVDGITLGGYDEGEAFVAFQRFILSLKQRGIILAVVSKNEHAAAIQPFHTHPDMVLRETDIAVFIANWNNKADNIRRVQEILNIGFDSMVFLDDNPFERGLVREMLPEVIVPELPEDPSLYLRAIADLNLFDTASYSAADGKRNDQYREEAQRALARDAFTDISDYLRSLDMRLKAERFRPANLARIVQLMQRSNQFNLTTSRFSEAACQAMMADTAQFVPFTITLSDKYGDYGLICVAVLKIAGDALEIAEFLMSCRVLKRGVEAFAMNEIVKLAQRSGCGKVTGRYLRTAKNDMVRNFYADFGFICTDELEGGSSAWALDVAAWAPRQVFITPDVNEI